MNIPNTNITLKSLTALEQKRCNRWSDHIWESIKQRLEVDLAVNDMTEPVVMALLERLFRSAFNLGWICEAESKCNQDFLYHRSQITGAPYNEDTEDPEKREWRSDNLEEDIQAFEEWVGRNYINPTGHLRN